MSLGSPDKEEHLEDPLRRKILWGGIATAVGAAALGTAYFGGDRIRRFYAPGDHGGEVGAAPVSREVYERLMHSRHELEQMLLHGPQEYFDALQKNKESRILVPQAEASTLYVQCVDERQLDGEDDGVAGVGVLLNENEREALTQRIVEQVRKVMAARGEVIPVIIRPHGKNCGAARHSLKLKKQFITPHTIGEEAMRGARLLQAAVERTALQQGVRIPVDVVEFPREHFLQDNNHPGGLVIVNTMNDTVLNRRHGGPLAFDVSYVEGPEKAFFDARLSTELALLSGHGMHDREEIHVKPGTPFTIVLAGRNGNELRSVREKYENGLARDSILGRKFREKRVTVRTWEVARV